MRIISGRNKGRKIIAPANLPVRPTTDMAKESLFNILHNYFDFTGVHALDLFTGTGNITYELVSRGCPQVTAVDSDPRCIRFVRQTALLLNYHEVTPVQSDYRRFLSNAHQRFELIFADPPYGMPGTLLLPDLVFENQLLADDGVLVIEHDKALDFSNHKWFYNHRKYGKVNFSLFRQEAPQ